MDTIYSWFLVTWPGPVDCWIVTFQLLYSYFAFCPRIYTSSRVVSLLLRVKVLEGEEGLKVRNSVFEIQNIREFFVVYYMRLRITLSKVFFQVGFGGGAFETRFHPVSLPLLSLYNISFITKMWRLFSSPSLERQRGRRLCQWVIISQIIISINLH